MLVLTRALGERIMLIGPDKQVITVSVERLQGPNVRVGIEAPKEVTILREEVYRRGLPAGRTTP